MTVSADIIAAVKDATDLPEVVGEYVRLRQIGKRYLGLCPFHNEKTESFSVNATFFKCFGCDAKGDVFNFVMMIEGIAFNDALKHLAGLAGISLDSRPVHRGVLAANREDVLTAAWWWAKKRTAVLKALYAELWENPEAVRQYSFSPNGLEWTQLSPALYPDDEFADSCGNLLRWIDSLSKPDRLQHFLVHVTSADRVEYRKEVAEEKAFIESWNALGRAWAAQLEAF